MNPTKAILEYPSDDILHAIHQEEGTGLELFGRDIQNVYVVTDIRLVDSDERVRIEIMRKETA